MYCWLRWHKVETLQIMMELEEKAYTVVNFGMKILPWDILHLEHCQWQIQDQIPMEASFSFHFNQQIGKWLCKPSWLTLYSTILIFAWVFYTFIYVFLMTRLDGKHVVFGLIVSGLDILKKIEVMKVVFFSGGIHFNPTFCSCWYSYFCMLVCFLEIRIQIWKNIGKNHSYSLWRINLSLFPVLKLLSVSLFVILYRFEFILW